MADMENNATVTEQETRTFTQDELNAIVEDRLARDRKKYADYEELKGKALQFDELQESQKTELQKATEKAAALESEINALKEANTLRDLRDKVATELQIPSSLLTATTEDDMRKQASEILAFAKGADYQVPDKGELTKKPQTKKSTRELFAEAFMSE